MIRVLVRVYVPQLEKKYDIWIPTNKSIYTVITAIISGIESVDNIKMQTKYEINLYNRETAQVYDFNSRVIDTDIRNGAELILQ